MENTSIKNNVTIIYDSLVALIIEATCEIKPFDSFVSRENSQITGYLYQSTRQLDDAINDYKADQLGEGVTAADLLIYRDNIATWD